MSTTIPLVSSRSARKQALTAKVAPCSRCAGPNTAPRNECATMMWSETSTPNTGVSSAPDQGSTIIDQLAQYAAGRRKNRGQLCGEIGERDRGSQQRVEGRIGEQVERRREPALRGPSCAMRGRNTSDLARHEPQAAAVEGLAQRDRHLAGSVPAQLDHRSEEHTSELQSQFHLVCRLL